MMPWTGATPRRARYLIPQGTPRRREVVAACAVAILVAHLLLAQVTLVLAVIFVAVSRASRWRRWWLLGPVAAGLAWVLAAGPASALAGFTAGPAGILGHLGAGHLGAGHLAGRTGSPIAGLGGAWTWLPRQLPVALITGAAEAALIGWLDWLHTDEWAVPAPRPGLIAAARRAVVGCAVRGGGVVTREGIALGVVRATGARAELRWAEAAHGTLIAGAAAQDVTLAGLQMVHAALRLRKPVIVLDPGDPAIARALDIACAATGVPLLAAGASSGDGRADSAPGGLAVDARARGGTTAVGVDTGRATVGADAGNAGAAGASGLWGRAAAAEGAPGGHVSGNWGRAVTQPEFGDQAAEGLGRAVRERSAVLASVGTAERAARVCAELGSLAAGLRRIGVDGDALVWVPRGESMPASALAGLLRDGPGAGLAIVIATTSPATATELRGLTGSALIYRLADPDLAAGLVTLAGTRLLPRSLAMRASVPMAGVPMAAGPMTTGPTVGPMAAGPMTAGPMAGVPVAGAAGIMDATDLVPGPVMPARALLGLGQAEFVLAVSRPRPRVVAAGRMVSARLPPTAVSRTGLHTGYRMSDHPGRPGGPS